MLELWRYGSLDNFNSKDKGFLDRCTNFFPQPSCVKLTHHQPLGKPFSYPTLEESLTFLFAKIDFPFDVPGAMPCYRKMLSLRFLFKFWNAVSAELNIPLNANITITASPEDITGSIHRQASLGRRDNLVRLINLREIGLNFVYSGSICATGCRETGTPVLSTSLEKRFTSATCLQFRTKGMVLLSCASKAPGIYAFVNHEDLPSPKANWRSTAAIDEVVAYGQPLFLNQITG
jgi:xanthine dehydrogenase/oxidase